MLATTGRAAKTTCIDGTLDPDWPENGADDNSFCVRVPTDPLGGRDGDAAAEAAVTVKVFSLDNSYGAEARRTRRATRESCVVIVRLERAPKGSAPACGEGSAKRITTAALLTCC